MTNDTSRITKVTTRNGDTGQTRLATNIRVSKADPWVRSLGSADELNSAIGLLRCHVASSEFDDMLAQNQQLMFDIGSVLAMAGDYDTPTVAAGLATVTSDTETLNDRLPPLKEFVIPGGNLAAAHAHMCRTICRRAETDLWAAITAWESDLAPDNITRLQQSGACLNRLSDFFFVLARLLMQGQSEPQWRGPEKREETPS